MRRDLTDRNPCCTLATSALVLLATLAVPLSAGAAESTSGTSGTPTIRTAAKAKAAAKPVWVQAAAKHGGSGVNLRYSVPESMQANVPVSLQLQLGGISDDDARVELRAPNGVTLTDASGAPISGLALARGQITTLSLNVSATADGMQFVDVFTMQGGRSSAQSVPLKVGKGEMALKKTGDLRIEPNGERVISMPAQ